MRNTLPIIPTITLIAFTIVFAQPAEAQLSEPWNDIQKLKSTILHLDSAFWQAYNNCDVNKMTSLFTDDVEFYHDKGGLTSGLTNFTESIRKGLCSSTDFHLRREARKGSVEVFPLNNYGAIISGEHYFYINERGKEEFLDGLAKFTHVWQYKDNQWKMRRMLSYDHGPASRKPPGK
jgi:hypothetical protein